MSPILLVFLLSSHLPSFVSLFQCRGKDSLTLFCILAADTGGSCSPHSLGPGWAPQLQNFPSVYQHRTHLFNKFKSVENWVQNGVFGEKIRFLFLGVAWGVGSLIRAGPSGGGRFYINFLFSAILNFFMAAMFLLYFAVSTANQSLTTKHNCTFML